MPKSCQFFTSVLALKHTSQPSRKTPVDTSVGKAQTNRTSWRSNPSRPCSTCQKLREFAKEVVKTFQNTKMLTNNHNLIVERFHVCGKLYSCMQEIICLHSTCSAQWPDARCQKLWKDRTYVLLYRLSAGKVTSKTHINFTKPKTLRPPVRRFITRNLVTKSK